MNVVLNYIIDMLQNMLIVAPIIIISRVLLLVYMKNKTTIFREIGIILFILFLVGLASQTITTDFHISSENSDINLVPFKVFRQTYHTLFVDKYLSYFLINFLGNILIFIPVGFFVPLLWNKKHIMIKTIIIGFFISLIIEISQLALPRRTDIDDLWLNTLGTLLGYIIFYIVNKKLGKFTAKFKVS